MDSNTLSTIDFLLFSYFAFSLKTLREKEARVILDRLIERAYRDAASHVKAENSNRKTFGKRILHGAIDNLVKCNPKSSTPSYDKWHNDLCVKMKSELPCTYGFAQKWVNMTMKYILLICDLRPDLNEITENTPFYDQYYDCIKTYRSDLHAPVDRYIINTVWKNDDVPLPLKDGKKKNRQSKCKNPSEHVIAWSKWDEDAYRVFYQKLRKQHACVIDWEGPAWIESAEGE